MRKCETCGQTIHGDNRPSDEPEPVKRWRSQEYDGPWYSFEGVVPFIYSEDFNLLWGLDQEDREQAEGIASIIEGLKNRPRSAGELTIVILWDQMPPAQRGAPYDMGRFVGPHDWAMALTWGIYYLDDDNAMQGPHHPRVRFIIFDAFGGDRRTDNFAVKALFALQKSFPWLYVDTIADEGVNWQRLNYAINTDNEYWQWKDIVEGFDHLAEMGTTHQDTANLYRYRSAARFLRELWREHNMFRAGDRHAVSNLLAPPRLASGLPGKIAQVARGQIAGNTTKMHQALLEIVDLALPDGGGPNWDDNEENRLEESLKEICGRVESAGVRFVLVDDHFDLGYHHILGNMLFYGNYNPERADNPGDSTWLFKASDKAGASSLECFGNLNRWLQESILEKAIMEYDVLFLDLRLWDNVDRGIMVIDNLLETITKLEERGYEIRDKGFKIVRNVASEVKAGDREIPLQALALLPLFLSCINRKLPIILFSSTHQWDILNILKRYSNIITNFTKPINSGYEEQRLLPKYPGRALVTAIKKALNRIQKEDTESQG